MNKLFRSLRSEHRKLWCKKSTIIWLLLSAIIAGFAVVCCASLLNYANFDERVWNASSPLASLVTQGTPEGDWKAAVQSAATSSYDRWHELSDLTENGTYMQRAAAKRQQEIAARESAIAAYRLEHDIAPGGGGMWRVIPLVLWMITLLICFVSAVAASDMFAGEYSRGTVYMNLARPVTRIKQYFAKMLTAWTYGALLLLAAFVGAVLLGAVLLGDDGGVYVGYVNGEAYHIGWKRFCLSVIGCCLTSIVTCITLCASLGTLTRSRAVSAAGASAIAAASFWLGSEIAPTLGFASGLSLFSCMDLTVPLMSAANYPGLSFADCCVSCGAHLLILLISGYCFMRRDISN